RDLAVAHAADEEIAGPAGDPRARIEGHARGRDRRHEVDDRRNRPLEFEALALIGTCVGTPQAHERPAVVAPRLDDVDLVAAVRSHLAFPGRSGRLVPYQALRRSMPDRIDLGPIALDADEGIVVRYRAVVV